MQHRVGRHHLGVEHGAAREQTMEEPAVPVRPVHHRCNAESMLLKSHSFTALPMAKRDRVHARVHFCSHSVSPLLRGTAHVLHTRARSAHEWPCSQGGVRQLARSGTPQGPLRLGHIPPPPGRGGVGLGGRARHRPWNCSELLPGVDRALRLSVTSSIFTSRTYWRWESRSGARKQPSWRPQRCARAGRHPINGPNPYRGCRCPRPRTGASSPDD